jgi:hypothetical protein
MDDGVVVWGFAMIALLFYVGAMRLDGRWGGAVVFTPLSVVTA